VGKVYSNVLNNRLMGWCEKNKVLVEEQCGFRPHRGCPDQIFTLVEIIRNRGLNGTYCCFIDVKKAFDRVFRAGLWKRVFDEGVKGKMWRVLRSLYTKVESSVVIDGVLTEWFPLETGVRQGCVLSPLLYALFINGLVTELNKSGLGVEISEGKLLSALLYADDIVLISENKWKLQKMLDIVYEYSKKWKFELNPKKSEVVVFGLRYPPRNLVMNLGEHKLKTVKMYKYLGIELTRTLDWRPYTKRILEKARKNMTQTWAMGISGGFMTVKTGELVWTSLVRSIVEYGCEVWGDISLTDFEDLQTTMGRKILRCGSRMSKEVIRGELGWETLRARRDEMRLRYWGKIVRMDDDRIPKIIYRESKERLRREEEEKHVETKTWCVYTKKLLEELGWGELWETERVGNEKDWEKWVREKIHEREEKLWYDEMKTKPKLRTYITLKHKLEREQYLGIRNRYGAPELTKLRGGTNRLRIEKGRYTQLPVEERICLFCSRNEVEDEKHFMLNCSLYDDLRKNMWDSVKDLVKTRVIRTSLDEDGEEDIKLEEIKDLTNEKLGTMTDEEKLRILIGDEYMEKGFYKDLMKEVMKFICLSMKRRRNREGVGPGMSG
jgi:hypothetical protein